MSLYLVDSTVLIGHLRGNTSAIAALDELMAAGHQLGLSCVNIAEVWRGVRPEERRSAEQFLQRFRFLITSREAARRAGRYQSELGQQGRTIHTPDALVAGTARAHGAILLTHNTRDFPMRDLRVEAPRDT